MRKNKVFVNVVYVMIGKLYGGVIISATENIPVPIVVSPQIVTLITTFNQFRAWHL